MNYNNLFKENLIQINSLLLLLAKRNDENLNTWCDWTDPKPHQIICYICNETFHQHQQDVWLHGFIHLKEHNLLPFI